MPRHHRGREGVYCFPRTSYPHAPVRIYIPILVYTNKLSNPNIPLFLLPSKGLNRGIHVDLPLALATLHLIFPLLQILGAAYLLTFAKLIFQLLLFLFSWFLFLFKFFGNAPPGSQAITLKCFCEPSEFFKVGQPLSQGVRGNI